MILKKN